MYTRHIIFLSFVLMVVIDSKWNLSSIITKYPYRAQEQASHHVQSAPYHAERAILFLRNNKLDLAMHHIDLANQLDDGNPDFLIIRANVLYQQKQHEMALIDLDRAIFLDPEMYLAYLNRGVLNFTLEDYQKAVADFTKCLRIAPSEARPYFQRAASYEKLNHLDSAIYDLSKFIDLSANQDHRHIAKRKLLELKKTYSL